MDAERVIAERPFSPCGFPKGQGEHLAEGWKANYWQPLEQFLS